MRYQCRYAACSAERTQSKLGRGGDVISTKSSRACCCQWARFITQEIMINIMIDSDRVCVLVEAALDGN